jgi:hypothetical protein
VLIIEERELFWPSERGEESCRVIAAGNRDVVLDSKESSGVDEIVDDEGSSLRVAQGIGGMESGKEEVTPKPERLASNRSDPALNMGEKSVEGLVASKDHQPGTREGELVGQPWSAVDGGLDIDGSAVVVSRRSTTDGVDQCHLVSLEPG